MLQLEFTDKMVPYDVFVKDLARELTAQTSEVGCKVSRSDFIQLSLVLLSCCQPSCHVSISPSIL